MRVNLNNKDITKYTSKLVWSGSDDQVARKVDFPILSSATDSHIPEIEIGLGDLIQVFEGANEIFRGFVFKYDKEYQGTSINVTAYEASIFLLKNYAAYNFKEITPEDITRKICGDFGIEVGSLAITGLPQSFIEIGEHNLYEIISKAYRGAGKENGKEYKLGMNQGKIQLIEKGEIVIKGVLQEQSLTNSRYSENMEEMVNLVKIADGEGNTIAEVKNEQSIKNYGQFQQVVAAESDKDMQEVALNRLKGISGEAEVEAVGNTGLTAGFGVELFDQYTGLVGVFRITGDTHQWANNKYTVKLNLDFQGIKEG